MRECCLQLVAQSRSTDVAEERHGEAHSQDLSTSEIKKNVKKISKMNEFKFALLSGKSILVATVLPNVKSIFIIIHFMLHYEETLKNSICVITFHRILSNEHQKIFTHSHCFQAPFKNHIVTTTESRGCAIPRYES